MDIGPGRLESRGCWFVAPSRDFGAEQWIHLVLRAAETELPLDEDTIHTWAEGRDSSRPHRSNSSEPERSSEGHKLGVHPVQAFHLTVRTRGARAGAGRCTVVQSFHPKDGCLCEPGSSPKATAKPLSMKRDTPFILFFSCIFMRNKCICGVNFLDLRFGPERPHLAV